MNTIKHDPKFKEIFLIVKSGIVGALALTGICIILFLIGFAVRGEFISYLYQKTFARCSFDGLFITTSGMGFILGMIVRRRLTLKNEIILIAAFSIPLIIGAWLLNAYAIRVSVPRSIKLSDCTNSTINIHLKVPKGRNYYLELAMPDVQREPNGASVSPYKFSGGICISNEISLVTEFPISSDKAFLGPSGFILTGGGVANTNGPILSKFLQAQKDYDIKIVFNPPPPPASSIQLHWWQAYKDGNK